MVGSILGDVSTMFSINCGYFIFIEMAKNLLDSNYHLHTWFGIRRSTFLLVVYVSGYLLYIISGAYMLIRVESDKKQDFRRSVFIEKNKFILKYTNINSEYFYNHTSLNKLKCVH